MLLSSWKKCCYLNSAIWMMIGFLFFFSFVLHFIRCCYVLCCSRVCFQFSSIVCLAASLWATSLSHNNSILLELNELFLLNRLAAANFDIVYPTSRPGIFLSQATAIPVLLVLSFFFHRKFYYVFMFGILLSLFSFCVCDWARLFSLYVFINQLRAIVCSVIYGCIYGRKITSNNRCRWPERAPPERLIDC